MMGSPVHPQKLQSNLRGGMNLLLTAWFALIAFLCLPINGWAQSVLPVPALSQRVIDQTGTLSPSDTSALEAKLAALEQSHGTQLVILMVPTTQPEDIFSYSNRVANVWKIGRAGIGDGLLIVVAKNDRRMRIEVAKTLEGAIPDVVAGRIISQYLTPAFRQNDYAGGLNAAVDALTARVKGEALPPPVNQDNGTSGQQNSPDSGLSNLGIFTFLGVWFFGSLLADVLGRFFGGLMTSGITGGLLFLATGSLAIAVGAGVASFIFIGLFGTKLPNIWGSSGTASVGGGSSSTWSSGGSSWSSGSSSSGGGFSSGGGGNFGGGGSSGSW